METFFQGLLACGVAALFFWCLIKAVALLAKKPVGEDLSDTGAPEGIHTALIIRSFEDSQRVKDIF